MKLFEVKRKINTSIANFNLADSIENLTEIILISIEFNDLKLLMETLIMIGQVYEMFQETNTAINVFNILVFH